MRNFGVERALARWRATRPRGRTPTWSASTLAGDEANFPAGDYAEAFALAADAGLGCTVHAGEWDGPESVRAALGLPVTRIGHGVRAIEEPALVEELARREVVLECCPTSNVVLGLYPSYEEHPLPRLRDAGVRAHAGLRRPALLRRQHRRRVRGLRASTTASARPSCASSPARR